jgi:DNA-binding GntR family transcriptional regulator
LNCSQKCIHFVCQSKHDLLQNQLPPFMSRPAPQLEVIRPVKAARSVAPRASEPAGAASNPTQRIAESIAAAIVERRLMPGTKLAEQKIADVFKVSRTLVRQALMQLSRDKLITLEPARGARVAEPSVDEARQVFEARNMLEAAMIRRAATELTREQIGELRAHLKAEADAVKRTDVSGRTRLLADFHVVVARMLGNEVLADMIGDLVSRSSLIALMYQSAHSAEHSYAEHVAIVDALGARDVRAAVKLMESHLHNVERNLQLDPRMPDLGSVLLPR